MGFLDRIIGGLNRVDDARTDLEQAVFHDRSFDRAEALAQSGTQVEGVVTGIGYDLAGDATTVARYRVEWRAPEPRVAAVRFGASAPHQLRLGSTVPLRVEGATAAFDLGLLGTMDAGRASRTVPEPGVVDRSLDSGRRQHLERWQRGEAHVVRLDRASVLGLATDNWDVSLRLGDGSAALVPRVWVPPYAQALVAPEEWVPVAVDPEDPTRAEIDFAALAVARAGGTWRDPLPPGSVAEVWRASLPEPASAASTGSTASTGEPVRMAPSAEGAEAIEGVTIDEWALIEASIVKDRVPPGDYDAYATRHFEVPAGRYGAIKAQWESRMRGEWQVGAAFGEAFERSRKELKKRPRR